MADLVAFGLARDPVVDSCKNKEVHQEVNNTKESALTHIQSFSKAELRRPKADQAKRI